MADSGFELPQYDDAPSIEASARVLEGSRPDTVYAHVPFCRHKCHYCDFYSIVDHRDRIGAFVDRFESEVTAVRAAIDPGGIRSAFVGGGTPTMLPPDGLRRVLLAIGSIPTSPLEEFTVEANPETVTEEIAEALVSGGADRVSIGCQSFQPALLETLERHHDPASVARSVGRLRAAGIRRINLDLIFGIPGATMADWERDLDAVLALEPQHLSCYGLVFEPGTPLAEKQRLGRIEAIDDAIESAMYDRTRARLEAAGYEQYEISNWALPGERCLHNLAYWDAGQWVAIGPAAAGNLGGIRYRNLPRLDDWLEGRGVSPVVAVDRPDAATELGERAMLGLRLRRGLDRAVATALAASTSARQSAIERHLDAGGLEWRGDRLRITDGALMLADDILSDLV
jgi:oxygen-independent coproporphyrinogen-3 oxidase